MSLHQSIVREAGLEPPPEKDVSILPPGDAQWIIRQAETFAAKWGGPQRIYRWTYDEALRHSRENAVAMRRDAVIMDALRARQIPTAQLGWHLEPIDPTSKEQTTAAKILTDTIESIPHFQRLKVSLLEALWYGRSAVQLIYAWDYSGGRRRLVVKDHRPINGDKLVFTWGGQPGVLVHISYPGDTIPTDRGRAHLFTQKEREALIIHQVEPEDADFWAGEMAGGIHGVGIRSRIYWAWWLRTQLLSWLLDYMEMVGAGGVTIYYYLAGNKDSFNEVKSLVESQGKQHVLLFPRYLDARTGGPGVQRIEPGTAGVQVLFSLIQSYFDESIRRYILGQELTFSTAPTGLGSGVASLHGDTFQRIIKYDAISLQETISNDLVKVLAKYTFPGIKPPKFVFDLDRPNASEIINFASAYYSLGGELNAEELRKIGGLTRPIPGEEVLSQAASQAKLQAIAQSKESTKRYAKENNAERQPVRVSPAIPSLEEEIAPRRQKISTERPAQTGLSEDQIVEKLYHMFNFHFMHENVAQHKEAKDFYLKSQKEHLDLTEQIMDLDPKTKGLFKEGSPYRILWQMLLVPTSYGQPPKTNYKIALKIFKSGDLSNPFTEMPGLNQEGKKWGPRIVPNHIHLFSKIVKDLGPVEAAKWFTSKHSVEEIRKYKPNFRGPYGNIQYYGGYIFGPKGGAFAANLSGDADEITKDVWLTRLWYRWFEGLDILKSLPASNYQRRLMDKTIRLTAKNLGHTPAELQAMLWYHEKQLWAKHGHKSPPAETFADVAKRLLQELTSGQKEKQT